MAAHPRDPVRYWQSAQFQSDALRWVGEVLAARGVTVRGALVPRRVRFWSSVLTVHSDGGTFWFKATNAGQRFEGPLLRRLGELVPEHVVVPVAVDADRGWLLLPDGGPSLRDGGHVTAAEWEALVVQAARMQVSLAGREGELAATGLPSLPPAGAHEYAGALIESLARLPPCDAQHVTADEAHRLLRGLDAAGVLFAELAASGVPATLQPNDTSAGNAVRAGDGYRFLDLGDAFWSHPFAVLQVPLRMATGAWPHPAHPGGLGTRLIQAYLEQWDVPPGPATDRLVDAADRLASLHRCESWRRLLEPVDPDRLGVPTPRLADWVADAVRPRATS